MSNLGSITRNWEADDTKRTVSLVCAILCALASGSNYGYSAYAPQLAGQLHLSSTQVNIVGTAGNLGMYLTGPIWGKMIDHRGQRMCCATTHSARSALIYRPLLMASILCFVGYAIVHAFYTLAIPIRAHPTENEPASQFGLALLCLAMFFTGSGGSAGLAAAINATAKSFSDKTRASMTGAVLAGFGLSAFTFSTLGHLLFGADAAGLLLLLTFGTGLPLFIGSFLVRPFPPLSHVGYEPILDDTEEIMDESLNVDDVAAERTSHVRSTSLELTRSNSPAPRGRHVHFTQNAVGTSSKHARNSSAGSISPINLSFTPLDLIRSADFWLLFAVLAVLCGTGLMYINNAGTIALALGREGKLVYDKKKVGGWQAKQVALVSIWNCLGRILGGMASDFCKTRFKLQRIWFLPVIALGFIVSQVIGTETTNVRHLWIVSTVLGVSYGSLFNIMPMLILEYFGMTHFSQNWGWTAVAPVLGGNIFNLLFGRIYDSNTIGRTPEPASDAVMVIPELDVNSIMVALVKRAGSGVPDDADHDCLLGTQCYATAFETSTMACLIAFGLSVFAGFRRERAKRARLQRDILG